MPKPFFHSLTELPAGIGQHICDYPQHILWILNHICRLKNCGSQTDRLLVLTDYSIPISRIESVCSSTCKAGLFFSSSSHTLCLQLRTSTSLICSPFQHKTVSSLVHCNPWRQPESLGAVFLIVSESKSFVSKLIFRVEWIQRRSSASEHLFYSRDTKMLTSVQNKLRSCASNVHLPNPLQLEMNSSFIFIFC